MTRARPAEVDVGPSPLPAPDPIPHCTIDGIPVSRLTFAATLELLGRWLDQPKPRRVATANLDFLALARRSPDLRRALATSDLVTCDGTPVRWITRLRGAEAPERVAGADLLPSLVAIAARDGRSVYFLGGAEGTAKAAAESLSARFPRLRVAGILAPKIELADGAECERIAARVRGARTDLLLLGLGCPKQELFLERHLDALGCRVAIGIGGAFAFVARPVTRAPRAFQRLGLEWLHRLALDPFRLAPRYWRDACYLGGLVVRTARTRHEEPRVENAVGRRGDEVARVEP